MKECLLVVNIYICFITVEEKQSAWKQVDFIY